MSRSLAALDKYLVGKWEFGNNFKDSSGEGNHGTPTDIEWKPTTRGIKPTFDGSTSYITVGTFPDLNKSKLSLHCILKLDNISGIAVLATTKSDGGGTDTGYSLINEAGRLWFTVADDSGNRIRFNTDPILISGVIFDCIVTYEYPNVAKMYINGSEVSLNITPGTLTDNVSSAFGFVIGRDSKSDRFFDGWMDSACIYYTIILDATEALALYDTTKDSPGVIPAERSYTHRLTPPVDNSTVFATDMHTKSGYDLVDLSGNGNNGTVSGAVRSGGYFSDGMRFNSTNFVQSTIDELDYSNGVTLRILALLESELGYDQRIFYLGATPQLTFNNGVLSLDVGISGQAITTTDLSLGLLHDIYVTIDSDSFAQIFINGELSASGTGSDIVLDTELFIGNSEFKNRGILGKILFMDISNDLISTSNIINNFNSIAVLPIFSFDAADYPANDTVYTSNIPYSSMVVTSGSFEINLDNELECISTGTLRMSNSHQFDESEYITLDMGGVKTSDTGSVTAGTTTASIAKGSNVITVAMETGDKINRLDVQFRAPVE